MRSKNLQKLVYVSTYAYLILPYLIFFAGWVRQPYATVLILVLAAAAFGSCKAALDGKRDADGADAHISLRTVALILLPVLLVALIGGAGGWGFQSPRDSDWYKHDSILRDLVTEPWPVIYQVHGVRVSLIYYIAYELPAALVGKLLGWQAANHALFLYTLVGLCLAGLWVWLLTGARRWWPVLVFLAFSGMDVVGQAYAALFEERSVAGAAHVVMTRIAEFRHLEWWAGWGFAQFSSMAALINMVPNQAIPGWLLTALILKDAQDRSLHINGVLYVALCTLWAPFAALGLIPFVAVLSYCHWRGNKFDMAILRQAMSLTNVAGLVVGVVIATYFASRFQSFVLPVTVDSAYREHITLTYLRNPSYFAMWYLLFVALEFALLHALLYWYLRLRNDAGFAPLRRLLILCACLLFVLPVLNWGWNNEPAMRTSIPALFITAIITIRVLSDAAHNSLARWIQGAILAIVAVGSLNAAVEYGRQIRGVYQRNTLVAVPDFSEIRTIFQIQDEKYRKFYNFAAQYLGSADSYFERYLAGRPASKPISPSE